MSAIHTHSIRLANGDEALVTRVVADNGKIGFGFSLRLDATESRHMAERNAVGSEEAMPSEIRTAIGSIRWQEDAK